MPEFQGRDAEELKNANILYAASAKRYAQENHTNFTTGLSTLNNGSERARSRHLHAVGHRRR